jgi:hypothetical protein
MGNEPDEEQQMAHMLVCSNEFDVEGLIAVTGKYLKTNPRPDLFLKLIDGYAKVVDNLELHAEGWPTPLYLRSITAPGQSEYGIADTGKGKSSEGSDLILKVVTRDDPRPVWVVVNAGSNTLAQALIDYQASHTPAEVDAFVAKLRVFENGAQDNAGAWICRRFPAIYWIRSNYQTYAYGGPGGRDGDIRSNLGPHYWQPYERPRVALAGGDVQQPAVPYGLVCQAVRQGEPSSRRCLSRRPERHDSAGASPGWRAGRPGRHSEQRPGRRSAGLPLVDLSGGGHLSGRSDHRQRRST